MPPTSEDEGSLLQDPKAPGSLASVFKGLAGASKLTRLPLGNSMPSTQSAGLSVDAQVAQQLKTSASISHGVPQQHVQALNQLKNGPSLNDRVSAAAALRQAVVDYPLNPVLDIWYAAKDLVDPKNSDSTRAAGWELLTACVRHQSSTALERKEFFQTISSATSPQDFRFRLSALVELARKGRSVSGFDYDIFPLVSTWLVSAFDIVKGARSSAKKSGSRVPGKNSVLPEEENFSDLFNFIKDLIKFNISAANEEAIEALVDSLLKICMAASVEGDLRACIDVLESIVTYGAIPPQKHKGCVQVLSSIHCLVPSLEKASWHTFRVLCRSHNGAATVRQLIEVLNTAAEEPGRAETKKQTIREVRGAISILQKLVAKSSEKGYPVIPFSLLVDGLESASSTSSWRIQLDILRLLNVLFDAEGADVNDILCDEDWAPLFQVAVTCASIAIRPSSKDEMARSQGTREDSLTPEIAITVEILKLVSRVEMIIGNSPSPLLQREDCIDFLAKLHHLLPDTAALAVLDYYKEFRCCFPSDADWEGKLESVLHDFFSDKGRSTEVRSKALQIVTELYDMIELIDDHIEPGFVPELVRRLLAGVSEESDAHLLEELVSFSCAVAAIANHDLFLSIIDTLRGVIGGERLRAPLEPENMSSASSSTQDTTRGSAFSTPSNVVIKGYVKLFVTLMGHNSAKATHLFETLVAIAKLDSCELDARLSAMKLLFRLRADWANQVFLVADTESSSLAATLVRTEAALLRKQAEEANQPSRHSKSEGTATNRPARGASFSQLHPPDRMQAMRSSSTARPSPMHYQQLWMLPDPEALPPNTSQFASPVLLCSPRNVTSTDQQAEPEADILRASTWLEAIFELLKEGCDWEVYSFMLVHLPSQLSNHALFKSAIPQMQELRRIVCEQLRANSLPEPPNAYGLRRADVAICYFQSLTMILSYHHHFQKPEEDDIVRTFVQGIAHWERSAKICIHALSICCHELPSSTSKMLVTMLSKMSQIITQPYVAMHILEFLTCLSRLPELYANFHQEEFRIVFGICFRYLQYAREKRQAQKVNTQSEPHTAHAGHSERATPNAADDLPQYVYALAYHVIVFWFMALKLPDRPTHVGWIAKNLFMDAEGAQASDEQAQTTIDFMQRVTYADVVESAADPLFTPDRFGPINKRRWLVGNSIVTIEQATASGWAQITKRHPSGTSSYMIRENFQRPPPHQKSMAERGRDENTPLANAILPNHLLVSLLTSLPQGHDHTRPIPLPDDDVVQRAIRLFDHNSTVDGHKVGIIYIGENQTEESDILANVSGSSDYVEFLNRLGTLTKLKGATFNTQGLDRQYGTDGEYTFCWRDRVTEMVFHVTTQMPTNIEHDPRCTLKKRHIGNDFVNIIFNDSGSPFRFDTFPSEFNYVNIVITPESRGSFVATRQQTASDVPQPSFYKVQVMSKPGFPEISPASDTKIVSLKALPAFIRLLALNASVFSLVWSTRESGGDNISSWRNRLREIVRLRDRFGLKVSTTAASTSGAPSPPGTSNFGSQTGAHGFHGSQQVVQSPHDSLRMGSAMRESFSNLRRSSVATFFSNNSDHAPQHASHRSSLASTTNSDTTEVNSVNGAESVVDSVDFSKWA